MLKPRHIQTAQHLLFVLLFWSFIFFSGCNREAPPIGTHTQEGLSPGSEPIQERIREDQTITLTTSKGSFTVTPVADYEVTARVVGIERYSSGWESQLSPVDLALAWGELSNLDYHQYISYSQRGRWYYYKYKPNCPFDVNYIINHSANHHIIPANSNLRSAIKTIKRDNLIAIKGCLVNIKGESGGRSYWWNTSTRRDDSGGGSCEIVYVESLQIGDKIYN